jgi:tripartite-type tricarboxylate transporter receptor subunit TctC
MRSNVPWDAVRDFAPVTLGVNAPNLLVVHPSLPVKSVKDLIALAIASAQPSPLARGLPTIAARSGEE